MTGRATSMTVARLYAAGDLRLGDEPIPTPRPDEVMLRVVAVGLCGSDRHWYEDGSIGGTPIDGSLVLGHEFVGVVVGGSRNGERVVADPAVPCGVCPTCQGGRVELCPTAGFAGYAGTDGALRAFATWPEQLLLRVPDAIGDDEATLLEPLGIALHAVHLAEVTAESRVAVIGLGPIGQLVVRALHAAGVTDIQVADPLEHRLARALASGARPIRDGDEVDVAIEVAGEDAAVAMAIEQLRPGGQAILVGIPGDDRTTFTASVARRKGLTLRLCRRMRPTDLVAAIDMVGSGAISLDGLVSHVFDLGEVDDAFEVLLRREGHKIVVHP